VALAFVGSLSDMLTEYNRVLWDEFPYCRTCYGQCCVLDATRVTAFDCIALALLGDALPVLPDRITADAQTCIYHAAGGCAWPADWRPVKCWLFYCALGEPTEPIARALELVIARLLPEPLREYERQVGDRLASHVADPVELAEAFEEALRVTFSAPFEAHIRRVDIRQTPAASLGVQGQAARSGVADAALAFVESASMQLADPALADQMGVLADQMLADLAALERAASRPADETGRALEELERRYGDGPEPAPGPAADVWRRMRDLVAVLRASE
jgi:hypothetical protein